MGAHKNATLLGVHEYAVFSILFATLSIRSTFPLLEKRDSIMETQNMISALVLSKQYIVQSLAQFRP